MASARSMRTSPRRSRSSGDTHGGGAAAGDDMTARAVWRLALLAAALLSTAAAAQDPSREPRLAMVEEQLQRRGIRSAAVLDAMRTVPRHEFVPDEFAAFAYADR